MTAAAFDTYAAAKRLRDAGFDERQAEAAVSMVRDAAGADREQLATKADVEALRTATKADLAELRAATKADLAELRAATKADLAELRADLAALESRVDAKLAALETRLRADLATKADLETLRSELRWMLAFQAAIILAIAAKLFGIV